MPPKRATSDIKNDLLHAALADVPFDGWSDAVLEKAAKRLKISADKAHEAFPGGGTDLALQLSEWADHEMLAKLKPARLKDLRVRDKIALAVRTRLEILAPHRESTRQALKTLSLPPGSFRLSKAVWRTCDRIWEAAGDTATDYNRYTKRLLLSAVVTSTTLFWLNDGSDDFEKTWRFLDRRIGNVLKLGQTLSSWRKKA